MQLKGQKTVSSKLLMYGNREQPAYVTSGTVNLKKKEITPRLDYGLHDRDPPRKGTDQRFAKIFLNNITSEQYGRNGENMRRNNTFNEVQSTVSAASRV